MMLAWILSPVGSWLSLVGVVFAAFRGCLAQGPGCRRGRMADKASGCKGQSNHHILGIST